MNLILSIGEAPDDESGSAAEKASSSTGKRKGLTKSKLKGLKGPKKRDVLSMSAKSGDMDETTSYACKARTEVVHRILEGHCDQAFELARDIGVEFLTAPGELRSFVEKMREVVFHARSSEPDRSRECSLSKPESRCCKTTALVETPSHA